MFEFMQGSYTLYFIVLVVVVVILSVIFNDVKSKWYTSLKKPPGVVPDVVFGIVWTFLYTALLIAAIIVGREGDFKFASLFTVIILLTLVWIIVFSQFQSLTFGALTLITIWVLVIKMICDLKPCYGGWKEYFPYITFILFFGWISVATYYNIGFLFLNPEKDGGLKSDL